MTFHVPPCPELWTRRAKGCVIVGAVPCGSTPDFDVETDPEDARTGRFLARCDVDEPIPLGTLTGTRGARTQRCDGIQQIAPCGLIPNLYPHKPGNGAYDVVRRSHVYSWLGKAKCQRRTATKTNYWAQGPLTMYKTLNCPTK